MEGEGGDGRGGGVGWPEQRVWVGRGGERGAGGLGGVRVAGVGGLGG